MPRTRRTGRSATAGVLAACVSALATSLAPSAQPLEAQAIRGHLVDDRSLRPVIGARVGVLQDGEVLGATTTDSTGFFLLAVPGPGTYALEAERLGYRTARSQSVPVADTLSVEFRLDPETILLDPIVVTARSRAGRNQFYRRMDEWGEGIFLGPEQIDTLVSRHIGEVFEGREEIFLIWDAGPYGPIPRPISHKGGSGCLRYMVDWFEVRMPGWIEDEGEWNPWLHPLLKDIRPSDLRAVEIYRSAGEAPRELRHYVFPEELGAPACGLVVMWTRVAW